MFVYIYVHMCACTHIYIYTRTHILIFKLTEKLHKQYEGFPYTLTPIYQLLTFHHICS